MGLHLLPAYAGAEGGSKLKARRTDSVNLGNHGCGCCSR